MSHECKYCHTSFVCKGKPPHATRWNPCSCIRDLVMEEDQKSNYNWFCKNECFVSYTQKGKGKSKEDDSSDDDDSDSDLDLEEEKDATGSKVVLV